MPEATPVHEAAALQEDLRRAGIETFAWIVNQSFLDLETNDPLLRERAHNEVPYLREVTESRTLRASLLPWHVEEPVGRTALTNLFHQPCNHACHGALTPHLPPMATYVYETITF